MPVLEAMQCGAVVIASRDPAILEVAGEGAILLDVADRALWMDTLRLAVTQADRIREYRERAVLRAGEFSWTKTAILTRAVYERAIQRFRK